MVKVVVVFASQVKPAQKRVCVFPSLPTLSFFPVVILWMNQYVQIVRIFRLAFS